MLQTLSVVGRDLRHAARLLNGSPGFTLAAVLSLALGIGANTAIFQLLEAVRFRTLPVTRPSELVEIGIAGGRRGIGVAENRIEDLTYPMWEGIRDHQRSLSGVFAWAPFDLPVDGLAGTKPNVRRTSGLWVSGQFFSTLGLAPHRGRLLQERDDPRGCAPDGAVISYAYWQRWFGGRDTAIGEPLVIGGQTFHVAGVMPPSFYGLEVGRQVDLAIPLCTARLWGNGLERHDYFWLVVMGRLASGWTVSRASEQISSVSPRLMGLAIPKAINPSAASIWRSFTLTVRPGGYGVSFWRAQYERSLWLLLGITTLVLAIAVVNVANLTLARSIRRAREFAVRQSLGASRGRLVLHALSESVLLAIAGTLLGVMLARMLSRVLLLFLTTEDNGLHLDLGLNWTMLAFASTVAALTCVVCGVAPALRSAWTQPAELMKAGGRSIGGTNRQSFQRVLVIAQIAISMVLVLGALLFVRSFRNLVTFDPGFQQDGLLFAFVNLSNQALSPEQLLARKAELLERVDAAPRIASAAGTSHVPLGGMSWTLDIDVPASRVTGASRFMWITPTYFQTMGMSVLRGRTFDASDSRTSRKVMLVNETFVARYLRGIAPIGAVVRAVVEPGTPGELYEVIGVVNDARYADVREDVPPVSFALTAQEPTVAPWMAMMIRTSGRSSDAASDAASAVRRVLDEERVVSPGVVIFREQMGEHLLRERVMSWLSGFFGVVAGLLATVGLYGVMSYMVAQRTSEIAIRTALGATRADILRMTLGQAGVLVAIGLAAGLLAAVPLIRTGRHLLFEIAPSDSTTIVLAALSLVLITLGAASIPAARAARVSPVNGIRSDG